MLTDAFSVWKLLFFFKEVKPIKRVSAQVFLTMIYWF